MLLGMFRRNHPEAFRFIGQGMHGFVGNDLHFDDLDRELSRQARLGEDPGLGLRL